MPILAPERRASARPSSCSTDLFLRINRTFYEVRALACDPIIADRAFRLNKADGTFYHISQTRYGPHCDCPDFIFRRDGIDPTGCKHVKALVAEGLIEGGPAD
jgi:hypothetical protein